MSDVTSSRNGLSSRQRRMLYPVYALAGLVFLGDAIFLLEVNDMRECLGEKGIEYCWMYGNFSRYFYTNLILLWVNTATVLGLYWLARRDYLVAYLIVWFIWLFGNPILSYFDISYC